MVNMYIINAEVAINIHVVSSASLDMLLMRLEINVYKIKLDKLKG